MGYSKEAIHYCRSLKSLSSACVRSCNIIRANSLNIKITFGKRYTKSDTSFKKEWVCLKN